MLGQAVFVVSEYWLATWARQSYAGQREAKWIWVYGLLVAVVIVIAVVRAVMFFHFTFKYASLLSFSVCTERTQLKAQLPLITRLQKACSSTPSRILKLLLTWIFEHSPFLAYSQRQLAKDYSSSS